MIPLFKPYMDTSAARKAEEILFSGNLTGGSEVSGFEMDIGRYVGNSRVLVTANHNFAMLLALKLAGVGPGDEVLLSPMGCLASSQPVVQLGASVVWVDIDPKTGTLCPQDLETKISSRSKAVVHFHWAGYPGHISEINQVAVRHGLKVIEDASQAFGAEYCGKRIGNTGSDFVCFSFSGVRLPNCVDGGAVCFGQDEDFSQGRLVRDYGIDRKAFRDALSEINPECDISRVGFGASLNNVFAAIGRNNLQSFPKLLLQQRNNLSAWDLLLGDASLKRPDINPSGWVFSGLFEKRDQILQEFRSRGIYASKLHFRNDFYSVFRNAMRSDLPGVDEFSRRELCLPSGWWADIADVEFGEKGALR